MPEDVYFADSVYLPNSGVVHTVWFYGWKLHAECVLSPLQFSSIDCFTKMPDSVTVGEMYWFKVSQVYKYILLCLIIITRQKKQLTKAMEKV